ncbi:DEAD/DEAH box helicase family protein, partial [uncultured Amaricoccus sp.]|uniref:type I restriction endonuclease subunit R n=1 Tax=uncultured Amaricoccus sp. TaxID=339341 RepID=UPI00262627EE
RTRRDAQVGQQQAKLYADCLEAQFGRRPLIFYTNGYEHWFWDDAMYPPRPVQGFLKKDELELLHQRRGSRRTLDDVEVDGAIAGRFYQARAIRRVGESFERDAQRKALLVMATGSGKTRTVVALVDQLMRANWVRRVLFLADRVALVRQAHGVFKAHLPTAPSANLLERHDPRKNDHTGARVFLSTYPTMMNLIEEMQDGARRFGPGHFDLIIIDEAHRSVYRKYRAIFEYFDSLLVGLTATPRDEIDRDTYSLFQLERGVPTDSYDLEDAVADGYLVPPKAVSVPLKFQREGIRYDDLPDEEKEAWDAIEWDEDGTIPDRVEAAGINKWLFNEDTVDKVLEFLMRNGVKVEDGARLGKTIVFAKNSRHAAFIVERFDANYPHLKGQFARLIDYSVPYAQSLIDAFSEADKPPHIAVSVDMLDTGIDVPEVVNLVFFKIVRSKTKFWQMIGRGTRLRPDLFGSGEDKENFLIFDFCQNFEFFDQHPDLSEGALGDTITRRLFVARVELIGELDQREGVGDDAVRGATAARLHREVAAMSLDNFIVRPHRRAVERFKVAEVWRALTDIDREELVEEVAGLPSGFVDDDLPAKQFDLLLLSGQLALLRAEARFASCQREVRRLAASLEALGNIPAVGQQLALILEVQTDEFWQDINVGMIEAVRVKLRDLVKLIESGERKIVYTDFEDEIGGATDAAVGDAAIGMDAGRFRRKVNRFLEVHSDHIALQKVRRAEQITARDVAELERMFLEEGVGDERRLDTIRNEGGLGLFFRKLTGLDRQSAKAAFGALAGVGSLSASQLHFIDLIINYLTERGIIDPSLLYESPFTDVSDQGLSGVFPAERSAEVLEIVRRIRATAAA